MIEKEQLLNSCLSPRKKDAGEKPAFGGYASSELGDVWIVLA